jgi:fibronectin type 3 domain-containing protein
MKTNYSFENRITMNNTAAVKSHWMRAVISLFVFSNFMFGQIPLITSFSPTSGAVSSTVIINGSNFSTTAANNIVYFGAVRAQVTGATAASLTVTVPAGATYMPVTVTVNGFTAYSNKPFIITFPGGGLISTSSFDKRIDYPTLENTDRELMGDIDGDGKSDLLLFYQNPNSFSVCLDSSINGRPAFASKVVIALPSYSFVNAVSDIDGDGKLDVIVTNNSSPGFSVYKNTSTIGNVSFDPGVEVSLGTYSSFYGMAIRDIDGDGKSDVVLSIYDGNYTVSVFRNTSTSGSISFSSKIDFTTGNSINGVAIGDIDGDGKPDLVAANNVSNAGIAIFRNTSSSGSITFEPNVKLTTVNYFYDVVLGDFDGDGKLDILGTQNSNVVSGFKNTSTAGSITFASQTDFPIGNNIQGIAVGDVDGDGKPDVASANGNSSVSVIRNISTIGNISFSSGIDLSINGYPRRVVVGDIDGNGKPELITVNYLSGASTFSIFRNIINEAPLPPQSFAVYPGNGQATLKWTQNTEPDILRYRIFQGTSPGGEILVDSTTAGAADIMRVITGLTNGTRYYFRITAVDSTYKESGWSNEVNALLNVPIITSISPASGALNTSVTIDGINFSTTPGDNVVYFGAVRAVVTGATSTSLSVTVPPGATYAPITVTVNNMTASSRTPFNVTFSGGGTISNASFDQRVDFISGNNPYSIVTGDIDGDGRSDIIVSNQGENSFSVLRDTSTDGREQFAAKLDFPLLGIPFGMALGDIDGDGKLDVAVIDQPNSIVSLFRNTSTSGNINFSVRTDIATGSYTYFIKIEDVDGDSKPDIVMASSTGSTVSVFRNMSSAGNIRFSPKIDFATGSYPFGAATGDIDGDGKPEILVANRNSNTVSVFQNLCVPGNINFAEKIDYATGSYPYDITVADMDSDGKKDMIVTYNYNSPMSIFKNTSTIGNFSFESKVDFTTGNYAYHAVVGDIDGDAKPDVILPAYGNNAISVFRNISTSGSITSSSLAPRVDIAAGSSPSSVAVSDMDGNGKPELVVANNGTNTISVLRNIISEPPLFPKNLILFAGNAQITLKWNKNTEPDFLRYRIYQGTSSGGEVLIDSTSSGINDTVRVYSSGINNNTTYYFRVTAVDSVWMESGWSNEVSGIPLNTLSITSFSPASGPAGTTVTITGTNFSDTPENNIVYFGSVRATVSSASSTSLSVTVPPGATYTPITVTVNYFTVAFNVPFIVTFPDSGPLQSSSFDKRVDSATGNSPYALAVGDIDGDGKSDIVTANRTANTLSLLRCTSTDGRASFAGKVDIATGSVPQGVALGDLNGDGKLDITVANLSSNTISIYENLSLSGSVNFAAKFDLPTGTSPYGLAIGDLDKDGLQDVVVTNSISNTISVFHNTSTFTTGTSFAANGNYSTGSTPQCIALSDIDGDGNLDVITANQGANTVSILRNTSTVGSISFAAKVDISVGNAPYAVSIGDIDGDGKMDIVTANQSDNTISVVLNISSVGTINFTGKNDLSAGNSPISVAIGDVNGDGKPDVAASNSASNTISLWQNTSTTGSSSFNTKTDLATGVYSIVLGDLDGNAKPEIIGVSSNSNAVSILRNIISEPPLPPYNVSVLKALNGHVNIAWERNTEPDFLKYLIYRGTTAGGETLIDSSSASITDTIKICAGLTNNTVYYFRVTAIDSSRMESNFSNEVNAAPTEIPAIASFSPVMGPIGSTVTINGEGFNTAPNNNIVYFGATKAIVTAGTTTSLTTIVPAGATCAPITVTSNGLTAYSAFPFVETFLGGGAISSTTFASKIDYPTGNTPSKVVVSDIDDDGKPDMIVTNQSNNTISILRDSSSMGNIAFASKVDFPTGSSPHYCAVGDIDGDCKPDVVTANQGDNTISILRNTSMIGSIQFASKVDLATGYNPYYLTIEDFDSDGKPDVVVTNSSSNTISVYRNVSMPGNINFSSKVDFAVGSYPYGVATGDLDGDGKPDIVVANYSSSTLSVFRNISIVGNINFSAKNDYSTADYPDGVTVADIDGDNKLDIAATGYYSSVSVLRNISTTGNINLAAKVNISINNYSKCITPGDVDGDGKIDLAIGYQSNNSISILRNHSTGGTIGFDGKVDFAADNSPYSVALADVDGDGKPEMLSANYGASTVSVFRNVINAPPAAPRNLAAIIGTGQVLLHWNKNLDYDFLKYRIYAGTTSGGESLIDSTSAIVTDTMRIVSGLTNGSTYYFRVTAIDSTRLESVYSNELLVTLTVPQISSFAPSVGPIGTSVTINGTNFDAIPGNNIVYFGAMKAVVVSASATSLIVEVPSGATYTPLSVTVNGMTAYSHKPFNVTFTGGGAISRSGFAPKSDYTTGSNPSSVAISDIDRDGKPDVMATNATSSTFSAFHNTTIGTISLASKADFSTGFYPFTLAAGDIDGDGRLDVVVANISGSDVISVFRDTSSSGTIQFAAKVDFVVGINPYDIAMGDIDNDGKLDIIVPNFNSNTISVLRNISSIGNIAFAPKVDLATGSGSTPAGVVCGDIDGDGRTDIAIVNFYSSSMSIFRNTSSVGLISFDAKIDFSIGSYPQKLACGDIDNDGKLDLVAIHSGSSSLSVFRNTSTAGSISLASRINLTTGTGPYELALGDIDGDGNVDIVTANESASSISILRNTSTTGNIGFTSNLDISVGSNPYSVAIGDLDGDAMPEIVTTNYNSNSISVLRNTISTQDMVPPVITHTPPSVTVIVTNGIASPPVSITASATDAGSGVQSLYVEYQQVGIVGTKTLYFTTPTSAGSVIIPQGDFVSSGVAMGVSYRVVAVDSSGNIISTIWYSLNVRNDVSRIIASTVTLPMADSYPDATRFQAYRIFSVPYDLDDKRPASILPNVLGGHMQNDTRYANWRFQRIQNGAKQEYEDFKNEAAISPGVGFFIIVRNNAAISTTGNKITKTDWLTNTGIPLAGGINGWYLVGTPINTAIARSNLVFVGANVLGYAKYTGTGLVSGWDTTTAQTILRPWEGIAVKTTANCTLRFNLLTPPLNGVNKKNALNTLQEVKTLAEEESTSASKNDWSLSINAYRTDNEMRCEGNAVGMHVDAAEGHDKYDMYQPPFIGEKNVAVGIDGEYGPKMRDFRPLNDSGAVWQVHVTTGDENAMIKVNFGDVTALPNRAFEAYAIDLDLKIAHNLKTTSSFVMNSGTGIRNFQIVVGKQDFIEANNAGITLVPKEVLLYTNYPNPFNPETMIRYTIPEGFKGSLVTLKVYDMLGREISTIVNETQPAGYYEVKFNGMSSASGVYFYRLIVKNGAAVVTSTKKMMLLK